LRAPVPVHLRYYTDPACPVSFGNEPALRKLMVEFGSDIRVTYVMGGLARSYGGDVAPRVREWLDVSERTGMPIDPRLWLDGPIRSSYPACMAVKAAHEQSADGDYLRALREGLLCFRRKLDSGEPLVGVAREAGLDAERFRVDLESNAIVEAFGEDLEATRAVADGRFTLPSASFDAERWVFGAAPYEDWRKAALEAGATPAGEPPPDVAEALRRFGRMAIPEVGAVCDLPGPRAAAELWRLATEWRARAVPVLGGALFEAA
jgi:predicted DsbA family dithiol-disulfide isomerase